MDRTGVEMISGTPFGYPRGTGIASGELDGETAATQLPNIPCTLVRFKALANNAGNIYLGSAGVTAADGTTDTTTGLQLAAGDDTGWIPLTNLNLLYRICDNAGDDLTYLVIK